MLSTEWSEREDASHKFAWEEKEAYQGEPAGLVIQNDQRSCAVVSREAHVQPNSRIHFLLRSDDRVLGCPSVSRPRRADE